MWLLVLVAIEFGPVLGVYGFIVDDSGIQDAVVTWFIVIFALLWGALGIFFLFTVLVQYVAQRETIAILEAARRSSSHKKE